MTHDLSSPDHGPAAPALEPQNGSCTHRHRFWDFLLHPPTRTETCVTCGEVLSTLEGPIPVVRGPGDIWVDPRIVADALEAAG